MPGQDSDAKRPDMIVIGVPGLPVGMASTRCDMCGTRHNIQMSTAITLAQSKDTRPPVVCYSCAQKLVGPIGQHDLIGNKEGRRRMGLDN
jgi:hypothetical protein